MRDEDTETPPKSGLERRAQAVEVGYISMADRPTGKIGDWLDSLPRDYNLDGHSVVDERENGIGWAEPDVEQLRPRTPSSHRSGTCFDVESTEMRNACVDSIAVQLDTDTVHHEVRHQRSAYHTDLVFADVDAAAVRERDTLLSSRETLHDPLQRFRVWWYTYEYGPMTRSKAIEDGRYSSPSKNRRHINWLLDSGYIAETRTNHLIGVRPPKIADLHAVELKRRDWKTALKQAERANRSDVDDIYLGVGGERSRDRYGYADYRWVALDAGAIDNALAHRQAFHESGVGLLAIAEGGTVVKHIDAEHDPRERYTRDRAYVESEVWEQLDVADVLDQEEREEPEESPTDAQSPLNAFTGDE